jgi:hypothetical protein
VKTARVVLRLLCDMLEGDVRKIAGRVVNKSSTASRILLRIDCTRGGDSETVG